MNKKQIGMLVAAAAAYGIFRYSKLTPEQKNDLMAKGKDLLNKGLGSVTEKFNKAKAQAAETGF
jgi:hypothetical protein